MWWSKTKPLVSTTKELSRSYTNHYETLTLLWIQLIQSTNVRSFLSIATILNVTRDFCLLKQESDLGSEAWRGFVVVVGVRLLQPAQPRQLQLSVHGITIPDLRGILCKKKKKTKITLVFATLFCKECFFFYKQTLIKRMVFHNIHILWVFCSFRIKKIDCCSR